MNPHVSVIALGVRDLDGARRFYNEGLGWPVHEAQGPWVSLRSATARPPSPSTWDAVADDAGVPADGNGFGGVTFNHLVRSEDRVDAVVLAEAERAGGRIVKPAQDAPGAAAAATSPTPTATCGRSPPPRGSSPWPSSRRTSGAVAPRLWGRRPWAGS